MDRDVGVVALNATDVGTEPVVVGTSELPPLNAGVTDATAVDVSGVLGRLDKELDAKLFFGRVDSKA